MNKRNRNVFIIVMTVIMILLCIGCQHKEIVNNARIDYSQLMGESFDSVSDLLKEENKTLVEANESDWKLENPDSLNGLLFDVYFGFNDEGLMGCKSVFEGEYKKNWDAAGRVFDALTKEWGSPDAMDPKSEQEWSEYYNRICENVGAYGSDEIGEYTSVTFRWEKGFIQYTVSVYEDANHMKLTIQQLHEDAWNDFYGL